jgi:hypothetical protein
MFRMSVEDEFLLPAFGPKAYFFHYSPIPNRKAGRLARNLTSDGG